jgi:hypothetical protein
LESALLSRRQDHIGNEIERCFRQSDLLSFATLLDAELEGCHGIDLDSSAWWAVVSGVLNLSHDEFPTQKSARCSFWISPAWKTNPPVVHCHESWMRDDWNWHAGPGGKLCYILGDQWRDLVGNVAVQEGNVAAARYASSLCLRNVRWLTYRHYIGNITRITLWPRGWPAWPHGDAAHREYLRTAK